MIMKKLMLADVAALTLAMGVTSAQNLSGYGTDHLQLPVGTHSVGGG